MILYSLDNSLDIDLKKIQSYNIMQQKILLASITHRTVNVSSSFACVHFMIKKKNLHNLTVGLTAFLNLNNSLFKSRFSLHKKCRIERKNITLQILYFLHILL